LSVIVTIINISMVLGDVGFGSVSSVISLKHEATSQPTGHGCE